MTDETKLTNDEIVSTFATMMRAYAEAHGLDCAAVLRIPIDETGRAQMYATSTTSTANTAYLLDAGLTRVLTHAPDVTSEGT